GALKRVRCKCCRGSPRIIATEVEVPDKFIPDTFSGDATSGRLLAERRSSCRALGLEDPRHDLPNFVLQRASDKPEKGRVNNCARGRREHQPSQRNSPRRTAYDMLQRENDERHCPGSGKRAAQLA